MKIRRKNEKRPNTVDAGSLEPTACFKYAGSEGDACYMIVGPHHRDCGKLQTLDMNTGETYSVIHHHQVVPMEAELTVWEKLVRKSRYRTTHYNFQ